MFWKKEARMEDRRWTLLQFNIDLYISLILKQNKAIGSDIHTLPNIPGEELTT